MFFTVPGGLEGADGLVDRRQLRQRLLVGALLVLVGMPTTTSSGPLTPGPKPSCMSSKASRCDRFVGQRRVVGHAEVDAQERRGEGEQHDRAADRGRPTGGGAMRAGEAAPEARRRVDGLVAVLAGQAEAVDLGAGEARAAWAAGSWRRGSSPRRRWRRPGRGSAPAGWARASRPSRAMQTVRPANSAALPAEARARPAASWGSWPSAMNWR